MKKEKREKLLKEADSKTICTSAVLTALGIDINKIRYSQCIGDMARILRNNGFSIRSRKSSIPKNSTVSSIRDRVSKFGFPFYLIKVENHVLLLGNKGQTLIDTDPRKRDRRKVYLIYGIERRF